MHRAYNHGFRSLLICMVAAQVLGIHIPTVQSVEQEPLTIIINRGIPLFTTDTTPTINGASNAPEDAQVTVTIDGTTQTTKVLPTGSWLVDWQAPLSPGEYRLSVSITDAAGNTATGSITTVATFRLF